MLGTAIRGQTNKIRRAAGRGVLLTKTNSGSSDRAPIRQEGHVRRKAILLASVAGASLAAVSSAYAEGLYFSATGGANFVRDQSGSFTDNFRSTTTVNAHYDPETGFLLATALGLELNRWLHGFKVELETSFRRNSIGGGWTATNGLIDEVGALAISSGPIEAHTSVFALMANAWYEFNVGSRFQPYFGGGVGWGRSHLTGVFVEPSVSIGAAAVDPFSGFNVQNSGFAYQLGAGVTTQVMPGVSLGLGYRYFDAPDTELFFSGKIDLDAAASASNAIEFENVSHSVALTLTIDIN
jgi:OOP family OmpA-OmpF porin